MLNCYIVDFYAPAIKLVIELDGSQHYLMENHENDIIRDKHLAAVGISVKRYSNLIISQNINHVVADLQKYILQKFR